MRRLVLCWALVAAGSAEDHGFLRRRGPAARRAEASEGEWNESNVTNSTTSSTTSTTSYTSTQSTWTTSSSTGTRTTRTSSTATTATATSSTGTTSSLSSSSTTGSSTTTTSTLWGAVLLALDMAVEEQKREELRSFAEVLINNVSVSLDGLNVQFGALAFSQMASYVPIQPMPWLDDLGDGLPPTGRDTHWALVRCLSIMRSRKPGVPAVVLLTTGVSDDSMLTRQAAFELQGEATIFSVATDAALLRGPVRRQELMAMGSLYDAAFDSDSDGQLDRRLLETPIGLLDLAPLLAQDLVALMLAEPVEVVELSEGLAPGFVVLIVLAGCCLCGILAGGFYAWSNSSSSSSVAPMEVPTIVVPQAPPPPPRVEDPQAVRLRSAAQQKDLRQLRLLLSEMLLKGWPEQKHAEAVLMALDAVARLRLQAAEALREAIEGASPDLESIVADARFAGVDRELIRQAEQLRFGESGILQ